MACVRAPWRLLPAEFCPWNTSTNASRPAWTRRGQEKDVWQLLLDRLSTDDDLEWLMLASTIVRRSAASHTRSGRRTPDRDRYRRWLAICWRDDGLELNAEMVRLGWVLAYRPGNDPFPRPKYEPQEAEARAAGREMWRGTFIPPWEWRHR